MLLLGIHFYKLNVLENKWFNLVKWVQKQTYSNRKGKVSLFPKSCFRKHWDRVPTLIHHHSWRFMCGIAVTNYRHAYFLHRVSYNLFCYLLSLH